METHLEETLTVLKLGATRSREWMHRVITLLEAAVGQLHGQEHPAQGKLLEAASLLRQQIHPPPAEVARDGRGLLLAWQARKVREYIDAHITGPVHVADLSVLIQRSEAHFSRSFKRTFGVSPHSFVLRRRVELAAQCMLKTEASLSDIALRCGFADQAHFCKQFRQATGETPAAWRRTHRSHHDEDVTLRETPPVERLAVERLAVERLAVERLAVERLAVERLATASRSGMAIFPKSCFANDAMAASAPDLVAA